jgi:FMN-dependent NADH-azoreductase
VTGAITYVGERAKQADFLTPYLKYALAFIGISDVHFIPRQGLVFGLGAVTQAVEEARLPLSAKLSLPQSCRWQLRQRGLQATS